MGIYGRWRMGDTTYGPLESSFFWKLRIAMRAISISAPKRRRTYRYRTPDADTETSSAEKRKAVEIYGRLQMQTAPEGRRRMGRPSMLTASLRQ